MSYKVKRKQAWLGSVIGAVTSIGSSLLNGAANRKQRLAQVYAQDYNNSLDEASSYSNALNSGVDYQTNYLKQFNQQAKLGKVSKLRGNIVITDGGDAQQVSNDTFLLRGGSHEDVNETGQTGIGINVGGNQIEAEGGEVAQEKNGSLRIFSAQPIFGNGMSPAQAILRGYNKDKVFAAQERFKRNNNLNDDGSKARKGGLFRKLYTATTGKHLGESNYYKGSDGKYHLKRTELKINSDGSYRTGDFINTKNNTRIVSQLPLQQVSPEFDIISGIRGLGITKPQKPAMNLNIQGKAISNSAKYRKFVANRYAKGKNYSNDVLDRTYETAYKKSQNDVVKDLRDTHFVRTANAPYTKNNKPVELYHTTNAENPNFTTFDTNIEGRPTAIYTTDSDVMSMSYNRKKAFNSRIEPAKRFLKDAFDRRKGFYNDADKIEKFLNNTYYEGMSIYDMPYSVQVAIKRNKDGKSYKDIIQNVIDDYRYAGDKSVNSLINRPNYAPQYMKTLYSNSSSLKNPYITIEGEGHNWNAVNSALENKLLYPKLYSDDITGNISTRDIERSLMDTRDADRVIINSITDYGANLYDNTPHTVIENLNPFDLKYSNPVTYDNKGNVIPLSQRDNFRNPDMRYKNGGKISKLRLGGRARFAKGDWVKPIYPTVGYHGSKRVRQYIAKAEGSDFAKQNKQFKGDAIGTKELELRNFMGKAYQHLNEGQRDALLSYYYNLKPQTFVNQYKDLRDKLINAQTEQEYNDTINAMKNSINVGWNNAKLPGLRNRRAVERSWFGYVNPTAQQMVNDKVNQIETAPVDNTMVQKPIIVDIPQQEVHVPAGVIPVQNTESNLFNGDIKQNIIDMGNQFKVKYSCGGTARKRSLASRPVKGMYSCGGSARPKKLFGDNVWQPIQDKLNGSGGVIPWQPNNHYKVQYPNAITETTPTIPYTPSVPETNNPETPSSNNNLDFSNDNSRLSFGTGDYISLGADLLSALGTGIINYNNSKNLVLPNRPAYLQAAKLATNYNIAPQLETIRRQRNSMLKGITNNTSSSVAALNRMNSVSANATDALNNLYATKENRETELLNQDALNQQQVAEKNIQNDINYNNLVTQMRNAQRQAQAQSLTASLSGVGQAINNFIGQGRQNYDDEQAMLMGIAASDYATPSRLIDLGVNLSPSTLAGIYRSIGNTPNPGDAPKPEDYSSTTEYSIAKNAYDRNIKAYNNRNAYANLIKSRMSLKNRNRYGII